MNVIEEKAQEVLLKRRRVLRSTSNENHDAERQMSNEFHSDWPDRASSQEAQVVLHSLGELERQELEEIDAALDRILRGTYGQCERCGGSIGRQRLRAIPEARRCITCVQT
jgi:DnaK suppressor protein